MNTVIISYDNINFRHAKTAIVNIKEKAYNRISEYITRARQIVLEKLGLDKESTSFHNAEFYNGDQLLVINEKNNKIAKTAIIIYDRQEFDFAKTAIINMQDIDVSAMEPDTEQTVTEYIEHAKDILLNTLGLDKETTRFYTCSLYNNEDITVIDGEFE